MVEDDVDVGLLDRRLARLDDDELVIIEDNDDDLIARLDRKDIGLEHGWKRPCKCWEFCS